MKLKDTDVKAAFNYVWLLKRIYPYLKPYLILIIGAILISIPLGLTDGIFAFILKPYFDYVLGKQNFIHGGITISYDNLACIIPILIVLVAAIQGIFYFINAYLSNWLSLKITNNIKLDLFKKLTTMDSMFFEENTSGIIINRYLFDPVQASRGLVDYLHNFVMSIFGTISLIIVMFLCSYKLATVGILGLCIAFLPAYFIRNNIKKTSNQFAVLSGEILTTFNETHIGHKVINTYSCQNRQIQNYNKSLENSFNLNINLQKKIAAIYPLMLIITALSISIVLILGVKLIYNNEITAGAFVSFSTSLIMLYKPIKMIGLLLTNVQSLFVAMARIFELFDFESRIKDNINSKEIYEIKNKIEFKSVDFEYIENKNVIKNFNFTVKKGEKIAIVGNSGGGKSTLVSLLPRLYEINNGSILFDNVDIRNIKLESLRNLICFVFQDIFLFTGTIRENILLGKTDTSDEELNEIIKACKLTDFIDSLPNKIDTVIGERGITLSGGERQRIAIARAMLKNSPLLILDEATSSLDNESEADVRDALENLIKDKTVFIIAHRLSSIKNADKILVLNNGELVEQGTHDELLSKDNSHYKNLYEIQFKGNMN